MISTTKQLKFFMTLSRMQTIVARAFDRSLPGGLGFNEFMILYYISQVSDEKLRRTDLASKMGLTLSGITRMLLPMEKLGLIKREASAHDGRVSFVKLTTGGKRLLDESIESAELLANELLPLTKLNKSDDVSDIFTLFSLNNRMN
jgi:DNA-binding MarR family transcriptional regulator